MKPQQAVSAEVMQIMARHQRRRRVIIGLFALLFIAAISMGVKVIWLRSSGPGPDGSGLRIDTAVRSDVPADRAFQGPAGSDAGSAAPAATAAAPPAEPRSLFDVTPGLGLGEQAATNAGTGGTLRTGAVLEQLASEREMQHIDFDSFDANAEAARAIEVLNGLLATAEPAEMVTRLRHGDLMLPTLERFADRPEAGRLPERIAARSAGLQVVEELPILLVQLSDPRFREAAFLLEEQTGDWLLDWESFVGYSQLGWDDLREQLPTEAVFVRGYATLSDYYNFEFDSPSELLCVRIDSPDNFHAIYAYVDRTSELAEEVVAQLARGRVRPVLAEVRYPGGASHDNQVILDEVVAWRWLDVRDQPTMTLVGATSTRSAPRVLQPPADTPETDEPHDSDVGAEATDAPETSPSVPPGQAESEGDAGTEAGSEGSEDEEGIDTDDLPDDEVEDGAATAAPEAG